MNKYNKYALDLLRRSASVLGELQPDVFPNVENVIEVAKMIQNEVFEWCITIRKG